jgi:hypothetical protein
MDRSFRKRVRKAEKLLSAVLQKRHERRKQEVRELPTPARRHATAIAAFFLSGQPKIDEPLNRAWARALRHYGINVKETADQDAAAQQLFPIIMAGKNESARFTEIFKTAPIWLLQFAGVATDARLLHFHLPDLTIKIGWGDIGYEEAGGWPLLPSGTITAGDPIPPRDARWLWLGLFCIVTPFIESVDELLSEDEEANKNNPLLKDISFALDLDKKPKEEWSDYEKRRKRVLSKRISRLEG